MTKRIVLTPWSVRGTFLSACGVPSTALLSLHGMLQCNEVRKRLNTAVKRSRHTAVKRSRKVKFQVTLPHTGESLKYFKVVPNGGEIIYTFWRQIYTWRPNQFFMWPISGIVLVFLYLDNNLAIFSNVTHVWVFIPISTYSGTKPCISLVNSKIF